MSRKLGATLLAVGLCCLLAAGALVAGDVRAQRQAQRSTAAEVTLLEEVLPTTDAAPAPPTLPELPAELASVRVAEEGYLGLLEIPRLGLVLPVRDSWDEQKLRRSPCLFSGDLTSGLVIAGHNYQAHFAGLSRLDPGDAVTLTVGSGALWRYEVIMAEILGPDDVARMTSGGWDLTLFTCTDSGAERLTLRCTLIDR